ncbi:hypothetical protein BH10PLA1_BH10PLA1_02110 [soil metagenome]
MRSDSILKAVQTYLEAEKTVRQRKLDAIDRDVPKPLVSERKQESQPDAAPKPSGKDASTVFHRIVVAVDNSEQSQFAIDVAARLAKALHSELSLTHVVHVRPIVQAELIYEQTDFRPICLAGGQHLLDDIAERLAEFGPVETILRQGDPVTEIAKAATELGADLLVIGTHGRGRFSTAVVGSVAQGVMRKVTCPVLCVAHNPDELHAESTHTAPAEADYFPCVPL